MNKPTVSVIMTVYNAQNYLHEVLHALENQTCKSLEVIAVDDGSVDDSGRILDEYAGEHAYIRVIHQNNQGIWRARETGLQFASGEYISFLDCDDIPLPQLYQRLYEALEQSDADMAVCTFVREELETEKILSHEMKQMAGMIIDLQKDPTAYAAVNPAVWNKMVRANIIRKKIEFEKPHRTFDDVLLYGSVFFRMRRIVCIPDMLYRYRVHRDSMVHSMNKDDLPLFVDRLRDIRNLISKENNCEEYLRTFDSVAFIHLGVSLVLRRTQNGERIQIAIQEARKCLREYFPLYRKPRFGIWWNVKNKGVLIKAWIAWIFFEFRLFPLLLIVYRFFIEKMHVEIKW